MLILAIAIVCYLISYPFFAWTYYDIRRFPRHLWTGYGSPHPWRQATVTTYVAGGLPVIVTALVWRTSQTRMEMREAAHRSERR